MDICMRIHQCEYKNHIHKPLLLDLEVLTRFSYFWPLWTPWPSQKTSVLVLTIGGSTYQIWSSLNNFLTPMQGLDLLHTWHIDPTLVCRKVPFFQFNSVQFEVNKFWYPCKLDKFNNKVSCSYMLGIRVQQSDTIAIFLLVVKYFVHVWNLINRLTLSNAWIKFLLHVWINFNE